MKRFIWKFLLVFLNQFFALSQANIENGTETDRDQKLRKNFKKPGEICDPSDVRWYAVAHDPHKFLYCDPTKSQISIERCAVINNVKKVFDETVQQCLMPAATFLRQPSASGSGKVGDKCRFNTDCLDAMYCGSGQCMCLSSYISRDGYCYVKINPSQSGCTFEEQCTAVWPLTKCNRFGGSSTGTCDCPSGLYVAQTSDGYVCKKPGACPTPEGAGEYTKFGEKAQTFVSCNVGTPCNSSLIGGETVPELFDCMSHGNPQWHWTVGICCSSRAYTCTMPRAVTSGSGNPEHRWYYNSITETCEQFMWYSTANIGHNANNFRTKAHCETYCQDICKRGRPRYTSGPYHSRTPIKCTGTNTGCDMNHRCDRVGSFTQCCPTPEYICSGYGGTATLSATFNPGFKGAHGGYQPSTRWYYSISKRACLSFDYLGTGGNLNNFASQVECQNFCKQVLCSQGSPILDANGNYQVCSSNANCPVTHQCQSNVCCPRTQTVCAQPQIIGTCSQFVKRYWYNAATRTCELFTYSGCQGNDNNFQTELECQNFCRTTNPEPQCIQGSALRDANGKFHVCSNIATATSNACPSNYECYYDGFLYSCCPSKAYTCSLTSQQGVPCGGRSVRWYYDSTTQTCLTFEYFGCNGNSNNFASRMLCESYCGVGGCPYGGTPYKESSGKTSVCSAAVTCPSGYECYLVTLGTNSQVNYCCPTKARICSLPPNTGGSSCSSQITSVRYYFNLATRKCTTFNYNGCEGNANNFATLAQCNNFCSSAACEVGEIVYINPNSFTTASCNEALKNGCPSGYACKYHSLIGKNVCCGATGAGVCPKGEKAFLDVTTQAPRECRPNVVGSCPANYLCRFNPKNSRYYCCSTSTGRLCPSGKALYFSPSTNRHVLCAMNNVVNTCPAEYSCQSAVTGSSQGFCCTTNPICPSGGDFYGETPGTNRNKPRVCTVGQTGVFNTCPANYTCQASGPGSSTGYCCTGTASSVCGSLLAYEIGRQPVTCQPGPPGSQSTCPIGYKCQLNTPTNTYYCCQESAGVCGSRKPYFLNNYPLTCKPGVKQCPESYTCEQFGTSGTYYCCAGGPSDGCPGNTEISITNPTCIFNRQNNCPIGYTCQFSSKNARYQCCGQGQTAPTDGCPIDQISYKPPGSNSVQICMLGSLNVCPFGYYCQYSTQFQRFQCCGAKGAVSQCPGTTEPKINPSTNQIQSCVPGQVNACSPGYICTRIQSMVAGPVSYICCTTFNPTVSSTNGCDFGTAFIYPGTNIPLSCTPGGLPCPIGYRCTYSTVNGTYKCCSGGLFSRSRGKLKQIGTILKIT